MFLNPVKQKKFCGVTRAMGLGATGPVATQRLNKPNGVSCRHSEMSSSYSANQYESAFKSQRLQNWCAVKQYKERPTALEGHTTFIANDRGHLLPGVKRGSAWPDFKGTWDLPARLPPHCINPTGRSVEGRSRLKAWGLDPQHTSAFPPHGGSKNTARLPEGEQENLIHCGSKGKLAVVHHMWLDDSVHPVICAPGRHPVAMKDKGTAEMNKMTEFGVIRPLSGLSVSQVQVHSMRRWDKEVSLHNFHSFEVDEDPQQDGAAPSSEPPSRCTPSAAEARPASQNRPITGGERPASQNQVSQAAEDGSVGERPATQATTGENRPLTQCSQYGERPASRPATAQRSSSRPLTGGRRPGSHVSERAATLCSSRQDIAATQGTPPPSSSRTQGEIQQDQQIDLMQS